MGGKGGKGGGGEGGGEGGGGWLLAGAMRRARAGQSDGHGRPGARADGRSGQCNLDYIAARRAGRATQKIFRVTARETA